MQLTRRRALGLAVAVSSTAVLRARAAGEVSDDRTLFWKLGSGASASTIFGYSRTAASLVPDIVGEGTQRALAAKRVIQDFPSSVTLPPIKLDPSLPPISTKLDAKTADALRAVVQQSFAPLFPTVDRMPGIEVTMLLMTEGQRPPPTVGGTIVERALHAGRPSMILISGAELRGMVFPSSLTAFEKRVGQDTIAYMLDLRSKHGPIGRQFEQLYAARRGGDLHSLAAELSRRGAFSPAEMLNGDAIKVILTGRLEAALKGKQAGGGFVLLPLDALLGGDGIVAALRKGGNTVMPVA